MGDFHRSMNTQDATQRRVLYWLFGINGAMFVIEVIAGFVASSTGLLADALDMLADASVYAISLSAVGASLARKQAAATTSGIIQIALGAGVAFEVIRRVIDGGAPEGFTISIIGTMAFVANITCLRLIYRYRDGDVNMRAGYIFSANDVIGNLAVIAGGLLVVATGSQWPDLAAGFGISVLVVAGGVKIIVAARRG